MNAEQHEHGKAGVTCSLCGAPVDRPTEPTLDQMRRWLGEGASRRLGLYHLPPEFRVSVVVPVYNERKTLEEIIRRVRAVPIPKEIILVDDGSTDGSRQLLLEMEGAEDLRVFCHDRNRGKGAALRTGLGHATGDCVVVQDADLEYDPVQYPQLIQPIVEGVADVQGRTRWGREDER